MPEAGIWIATMDWNKARERVMVGFCRACRPKWGYWELPLEQWEASEKHDYIKFSERVGEEGTGKNLLVELRWAIRVTWTGWLVVEMEWKEQIEKHLGNWIYRS